MLLVIYIMVSNMIHGFGSIMADHLRVFVLFPFMIQIKMTFLWRAFLLSFSDQLNTEHQRYLLDTLPISSVSHVATHLPPK